MTPKDIWEDWKGLSPTAKIGLLASLAGAVGLGLYARSKNQAAAGNAGTDSGAGAGSGVGDTSGITSVGTGTTGNLPTNGYTPAPGRPFYPVRPIPIFPTPGGGQPPQSPTGGSSGGGATSSPSGALAYQMGKSVVNAASTPPLPAALAGTSIVTYAGKPGSAPLAALRTTPASLSPGGRRYTTPGAAAPTTRAVSGGSSKKFAE